MTDQNDSLEFTYFISEKNGFIVASLVGMLETASLSRLEQLGEEILKCEFSKIVFNFRDVPTFSQDLIPVFARLQKQARGKKADLRICGLKPEIKDRLAKAGILRPHELADNLQTALLSMISAAKKAA